MTVKCPSRGEHAEGEDLWTEKGCSFCGSLHPSQFLEYLGAGAELIPTDGKDKIYVRTDRKMMKFRMSHFWADWN